ncbi:hypothetical protein ACTXT7_009720 [Hymenolepis weldensis]
MRLEMDMNEIIPGLWLGSYPYYLSFRHPEDVNIRAILTIQDRPLPKDPFTHFRQMFISGVDVPFRNLLKDFKNAFLFIEDHIRNGVLVHCQNGNSLSATIVLGYLMWKLRIPYEDALEKIVCRRIVNPNDGFVRQLVIFEVAGYDAEAASDLYYNGEVYQESRKLLSLEVFYERVLSIHTRSNKHGDDAIE